MPWQIKERKLEKYSILETQLIRDLTEHKKTCFPDLMQCEYTIIILGIHHPNK
jgi:hypothetical protein